MALYRSPDYQTIFESVGLSVQEKMFNIGFKEPFSRHQEEEKTDKTKQAQIEQTYEKHKD